MAVRSVRTEAAAAPVVSSPEPDVLFIDEAAALARVSESSMYKLVRTGEIAAVKRLGKWRIKRTEVLRWRDQSDKPPPLPVPDRVKAISASERTDHSSIVYPWDVIQRGERF